MNGNVGADQRSVNMGASPRNSLSGVARLILASEDAFVSEEWADMDTIEDRLWQRLIAFTPLEENRICLSSLSS